MQPDEPNDEEREEELPEDNGTPFRPADDTSQGNTQSDHPSTDTDVDSQEAYDEGTDTADEADTDQPPQAYPLDPSDNDDEEE